MEEIFRTNDIIWDGYHLQGMFPGSSRGIVCPHCKSIASMKWGYGLGYDEVDETNKTDPMGIQQRSTIIHARCLACEKVSYWLKTIGEFKQEKLIFPSKNIESPDPNVDMPDEIKQIYNESAKILYDSPRASAALSRLAIDELTKELEPSGKDLNSRIGNLVKIGLPVDIQESLDIVRVIGNNAVHPGEIDLSDDKEMALSLLELLNIIVDNRISQPKKIAEMYAKLPAGALQAISKRDNS